MTELILTCVNFNFGIFGKIYVWQHGLGGFFSVLIGQETVWRLAFKASCWSGHDTSLNQFSKADSRRYRALCLLKRSSAHGVGGCTWLFQRIFFESWRLYPHYFVINKLQNLQNFSLSMSIWFGVLYSFPMDKAYWEEINLVDLRWPKWSVNRSNLIM